MSQVKIGARKFDVMMQGMPAGRCACCFPESWVKNCCDVRGRAHGQSGSTAPASTPSPNPLHPRLV